MQSNIPMKNALQQRKAKGLDLTILIDGVDALQDGDAGDAEGDELSDERKLDLAPEGSDLEKEADPAAAAQVPEEEGQPDLEMIAQMLGANEARGGLANKIAARHQQVRK